MEFKFLTRRILMKGLIYSTMLTLAATTITAVPTVAQAQTVNYDASAPRIVSTDIDRNDDNHSITLYTGARPLTYVRVTAPEDVEIQEGVQVTTQRGRQIEAAIFRDFREDDRYIVAFAQPIPARTSVEITFQEVEPTIPDVGAFFNYEVAGKHLGLERLIPYGIARFQAEGGGRP